MQIMLDILLVTNNIWLSIQCTLTSTINSENPVNSGRYCWWPL